MGKTNNRLLRALNPIRYPWQAAKAPFVIAYRRIQGGALEANPYGTYATLKWLADDYFGSRKPPRGPGLEVGTGGTDADGFAIYGLVRVSGTSVIPPC
jgi:hypothetical protein